MGLPRSFLEFSNEGFERCDLKGYQLRRTEGTIGSAREFYFDDLYWSIRYLVADTARWLGG